MALARGRVNAPTVESAAVLHVRESTISTRAARYAPAAGWAVLAALGLLGLGGAAARPEGTFAGVPSFPMLALLGLVLAGLAWRAGAAAAAPCLGLAPFVVLALSGARSPGAAAFTGAPLLAVALAGAVVVSARSAARWPRSLFLPAVLIAYAVVSLRVQDQVGPQGDEPHYLMVADSLLRDGDLSLEEDYRAGRYLAFHDEPLEPHYRVRGRHGEIFSLHAIGLSLVLLPAYALGGYPLASLFAAGLGVLLALEIRLLLRRVLDDAPLADGLAWAIAFAPPLLHYAGLLFTEVPAALLVAAGLRHAWDAREWSPRRALAVASAVSFLPWLNVRYAPLTVILLLLALAGRPSRGALAAMAVPPVLCAVLVMGYHQWLYGFVDPRRVYGRRPEFAFATLGEGLPGLFLDQEFGLLVYAPLFVLALPGLAWLLYRRPRIGVTSLALVAVVVLTAGSWHMWRGGFNPPARFLVPIVPALALAVGAALRRGVGAPAALLVGWSLFAGLSGGLEPRLVHRDRDGTAPLFRERSGALEWTGLLPGYVLAENERGRLALVWAVALGAAAAMSGRGTASARGLATAGLGWIVATAVAGAGSTRPSEGRDAIRLVGRPALALPVPGFEPSAPGTWRPGALSWSGRYEPHRFPDGAAFGSRLPLPPGRYALRITGDAPPGSDPPGLVVRPEPGSATRRRALDAGSGGLSGTFDVRPGERAVTVFLEGGGPFAIREIALRRSVP